MKKFAFNKPVRNWMRNLTKIRVPAFDVDIQIVIEAHQKVNHII